MAVASGFRRTWNFLCSVGLTDRFHTRCILSPSAALGSPLRLWLSISGESFGKLKPGPYRDKGTG